VPGVTNGGWPCGFLEGRDGLLYGMAEAGGADGHGILFRLGKDGADFTVLHSFQGEGPSSVAWPGTGLLAEGRDGTLYGTTFGGVTNPAGTLFRVNKDGSGYGVLHSFQAESGGGRYPMAALLEASDSVLYGTAWLGGAWNWGTVFKLSTNGTGYAVLYSFRGEPEDTSQPRGGALIEGTDGVLYGTTTEEGESELGTVFRLNKDGTGYAILHRFGGTAEDGAYPVGPLVEGSDGLLYGVTSRGGSEDVGTLFALNLDGSGYRVLRHFRQGGGDGQHLWAGLVETEDGALFGSTGQGGDLNWGTLFRLEVAPVLYNPVWTSNVFSFQFNARSNVVYQPQFKTSLADSNWTALPSIAGQRAAVTVTDTNRPAAPRFYRVVIP